MGLQEAFRLSLVSWSFWFGFVAVFYFALSRFNEIGRGDDLDPPVLVRSFTTRFRYHFASFTYAGVYCLLYTLLVVLGSFPAFARAFEEWFGTVSPLGNEIGTPMWAAVLLTAVAPSLTGGYFDSRSRVFLQNFASIPYKARALANQILESIMPCGGNLTENLERAFGDRESRQVLYTEVREMITALEESRSARRAKRYKDFFGQNREFLDSIDSKLSALISEPGAEDGHYARVEYANQIRKLARLIVCALLDVEPEEYSVRKAIRKDLGLKQFEIIGWRFKASQLPLMVATIITVGLLASIAASMLVLTSIPGARVDQQLLLQFSPRLAILSLAAVPVLILPLLFVTGIRMYLIDQRLFHREIEWDERLLFYFVVVAGAFMVALLPVTVIGALLSGWSYNAPNLLALAPWALPAAGIATTYFALSEKPLAIFGTSSALRAAFDFALHGTVGTLLGYAAAHLSLTMGLKSTYLALPGDYVPLFAATILGLLGGTMGAIQCGISRQRYARTTASPVSPPAPSGQRPSPAGTGSSRP